MLKARRDGDAGPDAPALFAPWRAARGVLLAVSGGPDSVALMLLAARWRVAGAPPLAVAIVDHGLRPEAAAEAERVAGWARALDFSTTVLRWAGPAPASAVQARARAARYRLLFAEARRIGADTVMTAHHADDQAETVLMRLVAGSGVAGLAGMARETRREGLILARPLLALRKAALVGLCRAEDHPFVDDPSNADPRFGRARLRARMAGLGLDIAGLTRLAARAARAEAALAAAAAALPLIRRADGALALARADLAAAPAEIRLRALARAIRAAVPGRPDAAPIRLERLEALEARLAQALDARAPFAATLAGAALRLDGGALLIRPAPARKTALTQESPVPWQQTDTDLHRMEAIRATGSAPRRAGSHGAEARQERE